MIAIIFICGLYNIGFAIFHISFWKIFNWDSELKKLSFANKAVMQLLNVQIIYYFIFVAIICFVFPTELITTKFGNFFMGGASMFWLIASIFIIRAIGEFNYVGFFKKIKYTQFGRNDTKYYSPLCLIIGILTIIIDLNK